MEAPPKCMPDSEPLPLSDVGGAAYLAVEEPLSPAASDDVPHLQAFMYQLPAPEAGEASAEQVGAPAMRQGIK